MKPIEIIQRLEKGESVSASDVRRLEDMNPTPANIDPEETAVGQCECPYCHQRTDKPWENPQDTSREAVMGRLIEKQTADIERLTGQINHLHGKLNHIAVICKRQEPTGRRSSTS